jgi:acyl-CoA thioesterase
MPDENASIEEIREFFAGDRFATDACGCTVLEASRGHAVCSFEIVPHHRNAMGNVMGGAIFTLADFALAVASNVGEIPTVSVTNSIEFMSGARGNVLTATCDLHRDGRTCAFFGIDVTDELGTKVAHMEATCIRLPGRHVSKGGA